MKKSKWCKRFDEMEIIIDDYLNDNFGTESINNRLYKRLKGKSRNWLRHCVAYAIGRVLDKMLVLTKEIERLEKVVKELKE